MKQKHFIAILIVIPTLLLTYLVVFKKNAGYKNGVEITNPRPGVTAFKIDANKLRNAETVWTNREFLEIEQDNRIQRLLVGLVGQLPLAETAKVAASSSCWGMLKAYGSGDWSIFRSVRIPIKGYSINTQLVNALKINASDNSLESIIENYHGVWNGTFKKQALFNEVSLASNSVALMNMPIKQIDGVSFPQFTTPENQNWMSINPASLFDYSEIVSEKSSQVQVLRFFFFAKNGEEVMPYLIIFVWDEAGLVWLPWRMKFAFVKKPQHKVVAF